MLIVKGGEATDAVDRRRRRRRCRQTPRTWSLNNRVRGELGGALAALKLISPDRAMRLAAAKELPSGADEAMLPLIEQGARAARPTPAIKALLELTQATIELKSGDKDVAHRRGPRARRRADDPNTKTLLLRHPRETKDGAYSPSPTRTSAPRRRRA